MTFGIRQASALLRYNQAPMLLLPLHRRVLRIFGLATWLVASMPTLWDVCNRPPLTPTPQFLLWLGSFFVFGISFWLTFVDSNLRLAKHQLTLVVIQTITA